VAQTRPAESPGQGDGGVVSPGQGELLARCTFPPAGTRVTCAVSGGPDSVALLVLAAAAGCEVTAVHVDHGLRPASAAEAEVVAAAARRVGAGFRGVTAHVADGPNLEARARAARHAALPEDALFGHTADDRAETVLLHLLRGSGLPGLAGIRDDGRHPILGLRRAETRALCASAGLVTVDDPSNRDPRHRRNRVRHEVLPLLEDVAGRDVVPLIDRMAGLAAEAADLLAVLAEAVDATDVRALRAAPRPLAAFAVRAWVREATASEHPPSAAAVDRVLAVVAGTVVGCELPGGWRVSRRAGRLVLTPGPVGSGAGGQASPETGQVRQIAETGEEAAR
jgi:tRNA(Ile)-lysidine synthase